VEYGLERPAQAAAVVGDVFLFLQAQFTFQDDFPLVPTAFAKLYVGFVRFLAVAFEGDNFSHSVDSTQSLTQAHASKTRQWLWL
jgi:hypothetical protein